MWTRDQLKTRAKAVLSTSYWKAFLVSLLLIFVGRDSSGGSSGYRIGRSDSINLFSNTDNGLLPVFVIGTIIVGLIIVALIICFRVFLGYPLEVGGRKFFVRSAQEDVNMNYLGYSFNNERYFDVVKTMLYRAILTFLWTLLLIIPGIIKSYAYSMVPYILSDNPNIGYSRAVELSDDMTYGDKFDIFVLDLSFIGWYFLGMLALGIGVIFVNPYHNATKAELYLVLRQRAIDECLCTPEELKLK